MAVEGKNGTNIRNLTPLETITYLYLIIYSIGALRMQVTRVSVAIRFIHIAFDNTVSAEELILSVLNVFFLTH